MIELGEFDIKFMPRIAIKGQAVADFMAKFTYPTKAARVKVDVPSTSERSPMNNDPTDPNNIWSLRIDGSSNMNKSGAGVVLESPIGDKVYYALRLEFPASNNEAKYETLIAGLRLAMAMEISRSGSTATHNWLSTKSTRTTKLRARAWQHTLR